MNKLLVSKYHIYAKIKMRGNENEDFFIMSIINTIYQSLIKEKDVY